MCCPGRLELYYGNQNPQQPRGDYIRVRHVYLRSTRSYMRNEVPRPSSSASPSAPLFTCTLAPPVPPSQPRAWWRCISSPSCHFPAQDESQTAYTSCHDLALLSRRPFSDVSNIKRKRLVLEGPATMLINRRVFHFG